MRITAAQGSTFLDRMIALVEGAVRQKTPNEIALNILLAGMTLIFVFATVTIPSFAAYAGGAVSVVVLIALFVTLIPTTIGALLSAIGIAGMDRLVRFNVLAMSGRAVEAAGDVDTLLLDKTGTITLGNRQATAFLSAPRSSPKRELADAAQLASLSDETPEGRSIVVLVKEKYGTARARDVAGGRQLRAVFGANPDERYRCRWYLHPERRRRFSHAFAEGGSTGPVCGRRRRGRRAALRAAPSPMRCARRSRSASGSREREALLWWSLRTSAILGVIQLKDVVKGGIHDRFAELRSMGIRTVMITGDNPLTAAAIAAESGVDDFLAQATPEDKLKLIREEQAKGKLVAMCGDGTNDAPALAQAGRRRGHDTGTMAAREAGNMVDLDSDPTKLIEIVDIGKQLLMTRGALTTFSIANDVAKYFAIIPAMFVAMYPSSAAEHHACEPGKRDPVGNHLQCADHHRADSVGPARRHISSRRCGEHFAPQPADLRRRRHHRAVHRHQADRPRRHRLRSCLGLHPMLRRIRPAFVMFIVLTVFTGLLYPRA